MSANTLFQTYVAQSCMSNLKLVTMTPSITHCLDNISYTGTAEKNVFDSKYTNTIFEKNVLLPKINTIRCSIRKV